MLCHLGQQQKAEQLFNAVWKNSEQYVDFYLALSGNNFDISMNDCLREFTIMQECSKIAPLISKTLARKTDKILQNKFVNYREKGGYVPIQKGK